jgi:hypothetical protein
MTQDERVPFRQRERTQPGGYTAPASDAGSEEPALVEHDVAPPHGSPRIIKPRLGSYPLLREAEHRQQLVALNRRDTPRRWLFDPTALVEATESTSPALTVDAPPTAAPEATTPNDTLPPPDRARLVRTLRWAAAVSGAALLLVAAVVWSLSDGEKPRAEPAAVAHPPEPMAAMAPPVAPVQAATAVQPAAPPLERTAPEAAVEATRPEEKPQAVSQAAPPTKPKTASRDDEASPFGKWTVPPRD